MKNLKKDLGALAKDLKALTRQTERMINAADKLEKAQVAKKPKAKPKRKTAVKKAPAKKKVRKLHTREKASVTATDQVLGAIKRLKKGTDVPKLMKKTGFDEKKVRNIVARAFKQKKIKRKGRGIYVSA